MRQQLFKYGVVVVVAGAFTSIGVVAYEAISPDQSRVDETRWQAPTPTAPLGGGADFLKGVPLMLVSRGGPLQVYDQPGGTLLFTAEPGALVVIEEARLVADIQWFLVTMVEDGRRGWVPTAGLTIEVAPMRRFDSFRFCEGSAAAPAAPCGRELSLQAEAIWLHWNYAGLKAGDKVQRVLVINGERYQSSPVAWGGASSGEQLVNLLAEPSPRREAGAWIVEFFVNDELTSQTSVLVR